MLPLNLNTLNSFHTCDAVEKGFARFLPVARSALMGESCSSITFDAFLTSLTLADGLFEFPFRRSDLGVRISERIFLTDFGGGSRGE